MTSSKSSERVSKAGEWRARPAELTTISILFLENRSSTLAWSVTSRMKASAFHPLPNSCSTVARKRFSPLAAQRT